jgi:hypothetical protein
MNDTLHPARSPEFLSRLHDGEVPASEASAFALHRAACAECREAATAFAQSLAAFRSAELAPAAADLSARILRKIRAQSPSRRPFGVMFGIDIRWAGVFVAALLVVLLSAPALLRRPEAPAGAAAPSSIPARIVDAAPSKERARAAAPRARAETRSETSVPPPETLAKAKDEAAAAPAPVIVAEAPAEEEKSRPSAGAPRAKALAPMRRQVTTTEPAGGESGSANFADAIGAVPRLSVRPVDGQGAAPALTSSIPGDRFAALRGQEFVLVVEAQGRVRDVLPSSEAGFVARSDARTAAAHPPSALQPLRELRFAPGDRPRRLVVRIE